MSNDALAHLFDPEKYVYRVGDECTYAHRTYKVVDVVDTVDGDQRLDLALVRRPGGQLMDFAEVDGHLMLVPALGRSVHEHITVSAREVSPYTFTSGPLPEGRGFVVTYPTTEPRNCPGLDAEGLVNDEPRPE